MVWYHFFLVLNNIPLLDLLHFVQSPTEGHLGCFQVLTTRSKFSRNIHVQVFVWMWIFSSFGLVQRSIIAVSYGKSTEKAMAPHSSTLAWKIPWTEEPGRLSPWGCWGSDTTKRLHLHALEKEMATYSGVLAWRIPGTGEPGGLPSMGSHRVGQDWSDLAARDFI